MRLEHFIPDTVEQIFPYPEACYKDKSKNTKNNQNALLKVKVIGVRAGSTQIAEIDL